MSTEEKLVMDLRMMGKQLTRMADGASFVQDGYVRVSDPAFLSVSLSQAASAISSLSAEVQELRAERDMAERAAAEAAIPLEALMMAGQGHLSDAVWDEVRNGVGHVRSMLAARAKRRADHSGETGLATEGRQSGVDCGENAP